MDLKIQQTLSKFPADLKFYVTAEPKPISCVAALLGDKVIPISDLDWRAEKPKVTFFSDKPVSILHNDQEIFIASFDERGWHMVLGSKSIETITSFLNTVNYKAVTDGYMEFQSELGDAYKYEKGTHRLDGLKFKDLIGLNQIRDSIIDDIDRYFNNIEKYRSMGVNKGLNYIFHGPPGTGKTSFARALAHHYNASVFIPGKSFSGDIGKLLNPTIKGIAIVIYDDFNPKYEMKEYIQGMYDNGLENVIRIFITNNFTNINHTPFISRCRRLIEFNQPNVDSFTTLIARAFNVTESEARSLASIITKRETDRLEAYNKEKEVHAKEKKIFDEKWTAYKRDKDEKLEKPTEPIAPKPFEPIGYRDINFFISEFIGEKNAVTKAIAKIEGWSANRAKNIDASDSTTHEGCNVM